MNPILKREFFVRWRDWRSHLLLFGLAVLLCAAVYYSYSNAINSGPLNYRVYPPRPMPESLATRASRTGHSLFSTLAIGNVLVWFLMAPLLTATGVARERERGLLESLQLSRMTPRSQVIARALSALIYLFALQLMTLPVYFVAFSFGGVSQGEIARAWLLVATAAWCGVGLGLMLSASAGRPSSALFGAVALLCAWSFAAYLGMQSAFDPWGLLGFGPGTRPLAQAMYWSHPFIVIANLCEPSMVRPVTGFMRGAMLWDLSITLPVCALAWFCIGAFGLRKATRDVTRAFAPAGWAGRNPFIENWKRERQKRIEAQRQKASSVEGALLADLPFDRLIRFKNPLLNREVKGRFRLRRASPFLWLGRAAVFVFAVGGWVMGMTLVFDGVGRPSGAPMVMWMEWVLGVALVGTFASTGFAREREAGTWEGIRLSLLSNWQIARTKWASPLISFALLTCPLWLLVFAFAPIGGWSGLPFRILLSGVAVVATSLGFISALALWISQRARNTTTSTCWTVGILLVLMGGAPIAWGIWNIGGIITLARVGVEPYRSFSPWANPEYAQTYANDTGRRAPFADRVMIPPLTREEIVLYSNWFDEKKKQAIRFNAFTEAWNPALVLGHIGEPKSDSPITADDVVRLSLIHSLLCCAAIALLLGSVTLRLNAYTE
ncbi:hypothetical protein EON83_07105 [bacterium]|nr:MAG: hypothetical protein EON83_07105 [bacterium]